jgi:hypothetical protein
MTNFLPQPNADGLVKLSGRISNLRKRRESASFVFTRSDQTKMGVVAIAAALAGLGGQAMSTAANATAMEEEADYLQFFINSQPVRGWVWRCPFREGDEVEVAAEWQGDHYEAFGIARPSDRTIALYPHCSRGRVRHYLNAIKWWAYLCVFSAFLGSVMAFFAAESTDRFLRLVLARDWIFIQAGPSAFYALMSFSLSRKWLPFVRLAEKVFHALEWKNPGSIDLVKTSKAQRTDQDPGEFGTFYFRY